MQVCRFQLHVEAQSSGPEVVDAIIIDEVAEEQGACPSANARESVIQQIREDITNKITPQIEKSQLYGGEGGTAFDDYSPGVGKIDRIVHFRIRAGAWIDGYQVTYLLRNGSTYQAPFRGNPSGGGSNDISFPDGVFLTGIMGSHSSYLTSLGVTNSRGETFGPYGSGGGTRFSIRGEAVKPGIAAVYGNYDPNYRGNSIGAYRLICRYCHSQD